MLASGVGQGPASFFGDSPWWRGLAAGGTGGPFLSKLVVCDLEAIPPLILHFYCHHGDGRRLGGRWSFGLDRLGSGSSPSVFMGELQLPVFIAPQVALLAEEQLSSSSRPRCHRGGSVALT